MWFANWKCIFDCFRVFRSFIFWPFLYRLCVVCFALRRGFLFVEKDTPVRVTCVRLLFYCHVGWGSRIVPQSKTLYFSFHFSHVGRFQWANNSQKRQERDKRCDISRKLVESILEIGLRNCYVCVFAFKWLRWIRELCALQNNRQMKTFIEFFNQTVSPENANWKRQCPAVSSRQTIRQFFLFGFFCFGFYSDCSPLCSARCCPSSFRPTPQFPMENWFS